MSPENRKDTFRDICKECGGPMLSPNHNADGHRFDNTLATLDARYWVDKYLRSADVAREVAKSHPTQLTNAMREEIAIADEIERLNNECNYWSRVALDIGKKHA